MTSGQHDPLANKTWSHKFGFITETGDRQGARPDDGGRNRGVCRDADHLFALSVVSIRVVSISVVSRWQARKNLSSRILVRDRRSARNTLSMRTLQHYAVCERYRTITKKCCGNNTDRFVLAARGFEFIGCVYFKMERRVA
jgi:hypothetical protein